MKKQIDVAVIGMGTAALAALAEIRRETDNYVIISNGVYGTTCVRAGCMPSKIFIHGAQLYHQRTHMQDCGISGADGLIISRQKLLERVRALRQYFLKHTLAKTERYRKHIVEGQAWFVSPTQIQVNETLFQAKRVVLATGSSPIVPEECGQCAAKILTSDTIFEQHDLPDSIAVLGMNVLGTEMAQAFVRLGMHVEVSHEGDMIGGLTDPKVNAYALKYLGREMNITLNETPSSFLKRSGSHGTLFVAESRKANLEHMGLEDCGVIKEGQPIIDYNPHTMQVQDLPLFIAGDVKMGRSILHEALDEGKIAGYNAVHDTIKAFPRCESLQIVHTEPTIAIAGKAWNELDHENTLIGEVTFDDFGGRAKIMGEESGIIRIYADRKTQKLIGAELFAPRGEHMAHMLAWMIGSGVTIKEAVSLPFYHPSLEEALQSALEDFEVQAG